MYAITYGEHVLHQHLLGVWLVHGSQDLERLTVKGQSKVSLEKK